MANEQEKRDWLAGLELEDENLKANPSLNQFKNLEAALKGYVDVKGMAGRSIQIPTAEAGADAWKTFSEDIVNKVNTNTEHKVMFEPNQSDPEQMALYHQSIGVPEEIDGYTNPEVEGLNDQALDNARNFSHKLKLSPKQHEDFVKLLAEENVGVGEARDQWIADDDNKLKTTWGGSTDQRKQRVDSVLRGEGLTVENMSAEHYLAYDVLISKLQGQGPQGNGLDTVEVGPTQAELKQRAQDITKRLIDEGRAMGSEKYKNLQRKLLDTHDALSAFD